MTSKTKYPYFDSLEILLENDFAFKTYQPISPVKTDNIVPEFSFSKDFERWQQYIDGTESHDLIPFLKLKTKAVVIAFYSQHWGYQGIAQLIRLNELQQKIKATGKYLVVISPQKESLLDELAHEHNISLAFYFDQNEIARQFRVFDENSPAWKRFTGIDKNVPLLATYVLNSSKKVVYHHIDNDFKETFSIDDIVTAISETV